MLKFIDASYDDIRLDPLYLADFDQDEDVNGEDLTAQAVAGSSVNLFDIALNFGRLGCPQAS